MNAALHLLLFTIVGLTIPVLPMVIGRLLRPRKPGEVKEAIYECGEPAIGTSYIRFDLRFYVVALLFIVFDVEILFFFPWAAVFGTAMRLSDPSIPGHERIELSTRLLGDGAVPLTKGEGASLGLFAFIDLLVFFAVLIVGYAYLWRMGDLDWVRSLRGQNEMTQDQVSLSAKTTEATGAAS